MDITKYFLGKKVVQSAPATRPPASAAPPTQATAPSAYAKKSPFFHPTKRPLPLPDADTAHFHQPPASKKTKLPLEWSQPAGNDSRDDLCLAALRIHSDTAQGPAATPTRPQPLCGNGKTPMQAALVACTHQPPRRITSLNHHHLWTAKYMPPSAADLVGNQQMISRLRDWLSEWHAWFSGRPPFHASTAAQGGFPKRAALLCGPPGIGKTSAASIVSRELGFQVIEVNASDARGKADTDVKYGVLGKTSNMVKELITNHPINATVDIKSPHKKVVLLMDEVDGMSGGDRGGIQDLIKSIHKTKIPIICICNDKYDRNIRSLLNHCMELHFQKPASHEVIKRLSGIAKQESLQLDDKSLEQLLEYVQFDIRLALIHLQYRSRGEKLDEKQTRTAMKDAFVTPFMAADRLLLARGGRETMSLNDQLDLVSHHADLVPLIVQENYLHFAPVGERREDVIMNLVAKAADSLSIGDIVNCSVRQNQRWGLMPFASVESAVTCSALVRGARKTFFPGERNFNRFSGWLGKNATAGKNKRLLSEIQAHLLVSGNCTGSRNAVRLDYLPHICESLVAPLKGDAIKAGVEDVTQFMDEYCITREDRDAILDVCQWKGLKNPVDGISPQVKATFTRRFNRASSERLIKSSVLLPGANAHRSSLPLTPAVTLDTGGDILIAGGGSEVLEEEEVVAEETDAKDALVPGVTRRGAATQHRFGNKNLKRN